MKQILTEINFKQYIVFYYTKLLNDKNTVKIFGPKTWCTKNLSVIKSHTTWINVLSRTSKLVFLFLCLRVLNALKKDELTVKVTYCEF